MTPAQTKMVAAMTENGPLSAHRIAELAGMTYQGAWRALQTMPVHVAEWIRSDSWHWVPLYAWGDAEDAPKPAPLTKGEARRLRQLRGGKPKAQTVSNVHRSVLDAAFFGPAHQEAG
jgi:hypothetical protein